MKFKSNTFVPKDKNISEQQSKDTCVSKMVEPLTTVPPTKTKRKTASKSMAKKKIRLKKGESKEALSMADLHVEENLTKASEAETIEQASKKAETEETSKISPDVATPDRKKGKSDAPLISDVFESCRNLGLKDLNNALDSTESMDVDIPNAGNETNVDVSVKDPVNKNVQENVEADVGTSLGQPRNLVDDTAAISDKNSREITPEKEVNFVNTVVISVTPRFSNLKFLHKHQSIFNINGMSHYFS